MEEFARDRKRRPARSPGSLRLGRSVSQTRQDGGSRSGNARVPKTAREFKQRPLNRTRSTQRNDGSRRGFSTLRFVGTSCPCSVIRELQRQDASELPAIPHESPKLPPPDVRLAFLGCCRQRSACHVSRHQPMPT